MASKISNTINTRIQQKSDIASNWGQAKNFIPLKGEFILYEPDENFNYTRIKIGDGITKVSDLPFLKIKSEDIFHSQTDQFLSTILQNYIFEISYKNLLAFDVEEIVFESNQINNTSASLGKAILGQMILGVK